MIWDETVHKTIQKMCTEIWNNFDKSYNYEFDKLPEMTVSVLLMKMNFANKKVSIKRVK